MRAPESSQPALPVASARRTTFDGVPPVRGRRQTPEDAPLALRLKVFVSRGRLDRQVAGGCSCEATPSLALRAQQLTDPRTRRRIAADLCGVVDYVYRPGPRPILTAVVIEPAAVRSGRPALLGLAQLLEGTAPVAPQGVVLARELLTDGLGPLFNPNSEQTVTEAVREIVDALDGRVAGRRDAAIAFDVPAA
jgi:hypothetical protein